MKGEIWKNLDVLCKKAITIIKVFYSLSYEGSKQGAFLSVQQEEELFQKEETFRFQPKPVEYGYGQNNRKENKSCTGVRNLVRFRSSLSSSIHPSINTPPLSEELKAVCGVATVCCAFLNLRTSV